MSRIRKLAKEAFNALETKTRSNGQEFRSFEHGSPDWMRDMAMHAHNGALPDDYKYQFISEVLEAISSYDDLEDARDSLEADIYTDALTAWLHSRNDRIEYVNEAIEEYGKAESLTGDLSLGQLLEKQEVFNLVANFLERIADEEETT